MTDLQWKYNNNRLRYIHTVGGEAKPSEDDFTEELVVCNITEGSFVRRVDVIVRELDSDNRDTITVKVGSETLEVAAGSSIATHELNLTSDERLPVTVTCPNAQGVEVVEVTVDFVKFDRVNIKQIKPLEIK